MPEQMLEIDAALEAILARARPLGTEAVPTADADGRYLAAPVTAAGDLPPFTNSAMDGYALRGADTPGTLAIVGESAAGHPFAGELAAGEATVISTGAVLPDGADAVVPLERVQADEAAGRLTVAHAVAPGDHVRRRGSDAAADSEILPAGIRLGPAHLAAAIAAGRASVDCGRRPRVALLTTGDELVPAGTPLAPGAIHDSNGPMLAARVRRAGGGSVRIVRAAADDGADHARALSDALDADVVITTGGVSVGRHDLVRGASAELGVEQVFWRIRMRPGKPLFFGVRDRTLVFGLPGNPVSALVCFELFVAPALAALQGAREPRPPFRRARLARPVPRNSERDDLIRVITEVDGGLVPVHGQGSHQLAIAAGADGLARIPAGVGEMAAGSEVSYLPLPR